MKRIVSSACRWRHLLIATLGLTPSAHGQSLLHTGFENSPFEAGLLDGQDGWISFYAPGAIAVSDSEASAGRRCVAIDGANLEFAREGLVVGTCGKEVNFDPVAHHRSVVRIRADVRLDGPDTGDGPGADLLSANLFIVNDAGQLFGGFFVSSNGTIYAYARGGQDYMFATPYQSGTYAALELELDYDAGIIVYRVNGAEIGILDMDPLGTLVSSVVGIPALELAALDDPDVLDPSLYTAFFDNVFIAATP